MWWNLCTTNNEGLPFKADFDEYPITNHCCCQYQLLKKRSYKFSFLWYQLCEQVVNDHLQKDGNSFAILPLRQLSRSFALLLLFFWTKWIKVLTNHYYFEIPWLFKNRWGMKSNYRNGDGLVMLLTFMLGDKVRHQ